jgi:hypothetical protein
MSNLGFIRVKGIALAVTDLDRGNRFYGETLALPPDTIRNMESAYLIGDAIVMLKTQEECHAKPTEELNPRITVETHDAFATEKALIGAGGSLFQTPSLSTMALRLALSSTARETRYGFVPYQARAA